jgi:SAM-dependent methyltransferase
MWEILMHPKSSAELLTRLDHYSPRPTDYFRHGADRVTASLNMLPDGTGTVLELGCDSHFTLAMSLFTKYDVVPQNSPSPIAAPESVENPVITFTGEDGAATRFNRQLFDVERAHYPFADGTFDGALCCEVIEHLFVDPAWMLHETNRVLKVGGWLLLTTPNATSYHMIRKAVQGVHPLEHSLYFHGEKYPGLSIQHTREYAFWEIIGLLENCGFEIERKETYTFGPRERLGLRDYLFLIPALIVYNVLRCRHPRHMLSRYRRPHTFVLARKAGPPVSRYPAGIYFQ